jgi:sugar phosphate isomerase/epimerase
MNPKFACADFTFPLLSHEDVLDLISLLGFEGVDIGLFEGRSHLLPSVEFKSLRRHARILSRHLSERGLSAADIFLQTATDFRSLAPNHPQATKRAQARDLFLQTLEYAAECRCQHVSALPGIYFPEEPKSNSFGRCSEELAWRCEQAQSLGITFGVEAHLGSIAPSPDAALRLLKATPGLTLTLDYTHFVRCGIPDAAADPLIAYASHFHARGACKGRLQTALPSNTIDYGRIVKKMKQTGYSGYIGIEYVWTEWERCNEVDNLSETIRLRNFIRTAWKG